jgi:hypothetical protein
MAKYLSRLFVIAYLFTANYSKAIGINPGFAGKKFAVGISAQYSIFNSIMLLDTIKYKYKCVMSYSAYGEAVLKKRLSLGVHFGFQKTPIYGENGNFGLWNDGSKNVDINYPPHYYRLQIVGGQALINSISLGLKLNFFSQRSTIAAPIGRNCYVKADFIRNKMVDNQFITEASSDLTKTQLSHLNIPKFETAQSSSFSIGTGFECRTMVTNIMFVRCHMEANLSFAYFNNFRESTDDYQEGLNRITSLSTIYKNLLQVGAGVGFLL